MTFWNVASLVNKDKEFWEGLKDWDIMVLSETWVEEEGWRRVREELPGGGLVRGGRRPREDT